MTIMPPHVKRRRDYQLDTQALTRIQKAISLDTDISPEDRKKCYDALDIAINVTREADKRRSLANAS